MYYLFEQRSGDVSNVLMFLIPVLALFVIAARRVGINVGRWMTLPLTALKIVAENEEKKVEQVVGSVEEKEFGLQGRDALLGSLLEDFELERRAVFSKTWLPITHTTRFHKPGDYHSAVIANYPIFFVLGKDLRLRAFHDVCRHRAYRVTRKHAGSSLVLSCRYHGWSYSTTGELIKAPKFEKVEGWDEVRRENGLWEVRTWVDGAGVVWVNLEAEAEGFVGSGEVVEPVGGVKGASWIGGWEVELEVDWKSIDLSKVLESLHLRQSWKDLATSLITTNPSPEPSKMQDLAPGASLRLLPTANAAIIARVDPKGPRQCNLRFDIFSYSPTAAPSSLTTTIPTWQRSTRAPDILSRASKLPLRDERTSKLLNNHLKEEQRLGRCINPAARNPVASAAFTAAEDLCRSLECTSRSTCDKSGGGVEGSVGKLSW